MAYSNTLKRHLGKAVRVRGGTRLKRDTSIGKFEKTEIPPYFTRDDEFYQVERRDATLKSDTGKGVLEKNETSLSSLTRSDGFNQSQSRVCIVVKELPTSQPEIKYFKPRPSNINPNEFKFIITGNSICQRTRGPFLLILVLSVHAHIETREVIRNTYGSLVNRSIWPLIGKVKESIKIAFLFGIGRPAFKNSILKKESELYGDIVQADFVDSYFNLTRKVLTGLRWASIFCPHAKFVLKADEDVFVHIPNLINALKSSPTYGDAMIYGHVQPNATVIRKGRWAVAESAFPFEKYPAYTAGNTYVLSGNIIKSIYNASQYIPFIHIEDAFLTGIVRKSLHIRISDITGFTHFSEKKPNACGFKNDVRISATRVTDSLKYEIWQGLKEKRLEDCYKPSKRKAEPLD